MNLLLNQTDYLSGFFVFVFGLFPVCFFGKKLKITVCGYLLIYCWHTLFCIAYFWYVLSFGGDAFSYYDSAKNNTFTISFGTSAIDAITYILVQYFHLSELPIFLVFNIFGSVGLLFFLNSLLWASEKKKLLTKMVWFIVLLPSVSFWSSAIGKDSLSFLSVSLALWASISLKKRFYAIVLAIGVMFLIRPHMAIMMSIALLLALIFENRFSILWKIFFLAVAFIFIVPAALFAVEYVGITDGISIYSFKEYVEVRQSFNDGNTGIDISEMNLFEQLFGYLFRPTFLEIDSFFSLAAAFDNLLLLFLFVIGGYHLVHTEGTNFAESRVFLWSYSLMAWLILAMTTANIGIAIRQKWMFVPCLIFLFISIIGRRGGRISHL